MNFWTPLSLLHCIHTKEIFYLTSSFEVRQCSGFCPISMWSHPWKTTQPHWLHCVSQYYYKFITYYYLCHAYLSNLSIIFYYKSRLFIYLLCSSVVIYPQSPHCGFTRLAMLFGLCYLATIITQLSSPLQNTSYSSSLEEQVLHNEYRTAVKSPNLFMGLGTGVFQMKNLNVQSIKQSIQIFCFTSDILNLRNGLT